MARILLVGVDLLVRTRLAGLLADHEILTAEASGSPDIVIVDVGRSEPGEIAARFPGVALLGFTNHTNTAGLRSARAAGFDQVVAKSALFQRAATLVAQLSGSVDSGP